MLPLNKVVHGDCLTVMWDFPDESIDFAMFSPPYYGLRDYGETTETVWGGDDSCEHEWGTEITTKTRGTLHGPNASVGNVLSGISGTEINQGSFCIKCGAWKGQLGLEPSWQMYVAHMVEVCREIKRVLKKTGSMYIVLGDTYAGSCSQGSQSENQPYLRPYPQRKALQPKCLMGIPWRVAFALIDDDWILRNAIIWHKPNAMPSSVKDRLTQTYEHIFHFVKARRYYYNLDAIREQHKTDKCWGQAHRKGSNSPAALDKRGYVGGGPSLHQKPHHPLGKNPGDVVITRKYRIGDAISERIKANLEHFISKGSGGHYAYGGLDSPEGKHQHPLGKNPGDVIQASPETRTLGAVIGKRGAVKVPGGKGWVGHPPGGMARIVRERDPRWLPPKGKNPRDFWSIRTKPFKGAHFAVYPEEVCVRPILSSCPPGGIVLDPMCGSGTTLVVAKKLGRNYIGIDINFDYVAMARERLSGVDVCLDRFMESERQEDKRR